MAAKGLTIRERCIESATEAYRLEVQNLQCKPEVERAQASCRSGFRVQLKQLRSEADKAKFEFYETRIALRHQLRERQLDEKQYYEQYAADVRPLKDAWKQKEAVFCSLNLEVENKLSEIRKLFAEKIA